MSVILQPREQRNIFLDNYGVSLDSFKRDEASYINQLYDQFLDAVQQDALDGMFKDTAKVRTLRSKEVTFELYLEQCLLTLGWRINKDIPNSYEQGDIRSLGEKNDMIDFCKLGKDIIKRFLTLSEEKKNKILISREGKL